MNTRLRTKHKCIILLILLVPFMFACNEFLDVNEDPNAATNPPGETLFPGVQATLESQRNAELGQNISFMVQTMAANGSAGVFIDPERWIVSTFTNGNSWTSFNTNINQNLQLFIDLAQDQDPVPVNSIAQAEIIQVYTRWAMTVIWEDIPFTQANNTEFPTPEFDAQENVLRGLVTKIDEILNRIDLNSAVPNVSTGDLYYSGDMELWIRFAKSLKLRILMFIFNQDESVASEIQNLIDDPQLIRTNGNNTLFPYNDSEGNENQMFQLHADFAGGQPLFFFGSKVMVDIMNETADPRRTTYYLPNAEGEFVGQAPGATNFNFGDDFSLVGTNIIRPTFPGRVMTASEVLFHEAEFLARQGSMNEARIKFEEALFASLSFFDGLPGAIEGDDKLSFINGIIGDFDAASDAEKVRLIQEQHFIDVFEKTPENWALWKRTKVPELITPVQPNLSDVIRRFDYPSAERSANPNTPTTVPLITPMWFEN